MVPCVEKLMLQSKQHLLFFSPSLHMVYYCIQRLMHPTLTTREGPTQRGQRVHTLSTPAFLRVGKMEPGKERTGIG